MYRDCLIASLKQSGRGAVSDKQAFKPISISTEPRVSDTPREFISQGPWTGGDFRDLLGPYSRGISESLKASISDRVLRNRSFFQRGCEAILTHFQAGFETFYVQISIFLWISNTQGT